MSLVAVSRRRLIQPGPPAVERIESLVGSSRHLRFQLTPGLTLNDAVAAPLLAAGLEGATLRLQGGALAPFRYCMPALSPDATHAAWYSAPFAPEGETRLETATVTFGRRDGEPFIHCHALWREADGLARGGHILPYDTVVATPIEAVAWGAPDMAIRAVADEETNFTLFQPVALEGAAKGASPPRLIFARIRPNEDLCEAIAALCERHGLAGARVRGSVGSLIQPRFLDGRRVADIATEVLIEDGTATKQVGGAWQVDLDVALVDTSGTAYRGRLTPGDNPVCITFEIVIEDATS